MFKRLLIALGGLVVVVVLLAAYLIATFDPNDYKARIENLVEAQTGRALEISGDIRLSMFPWLGLELRETRLANAQGFSPDDFLRVQEVEVSVALLPLLRRELQVQSLRFEGLELYLAIDAQGRANWEDLIQPTEAAVDTPATTDSREGLTLADVDIDGLRIADARLYWDDQQTDTRLRVEPFNLTLGRLRPGAETPLDAQLDLWLEDPEVHASLGLTGLLRLDLQEQRYALRRLMLVAQLEGEPLPAEINVSLQGDVVADLSAQVVRMERLSLDALGATLTGLVTISGLDSSEPSVSGEFRSDLLNPRSLLSELSIDLPPIAREDAFSAASIDVEFEMRGNAIQLSPISLRLDDSNLQGSFTLTDFAQPAIRTRLELDRINVDDYLPVGEAMDEPAAGTPAEWSDEKIELPLEALRSLNLDGEFKVAQLTVMNLALTDANAAIRARNGLLELRSLTGNAYQGSLSSTASLDVRAEVPAITAGAQLGNVQFGPLLVDLLGNQLVTGAAHAELNVNTRGQSIKQWIAALNGNGSMRAEDGAVMGINVAQIIRDAEARLRGRSAAAEEEPRKTDFTAISASFAIRNGVVSNDDLTASSPLLRVTGRGQADLNAQTLDYRLDTRLVATLEGQDGQPLDQLRNVNLPITIRGTFAEPRFGLDLQAILGDRLREEIRERVTPQIEEQRDRVREEVDRLRDSVGDSLLDRLRR
ncbi:AsmA protein [Ectothiorhodosinus mongolicus]|uniref:AsmA protein n=1 Tax=Ectothiorhodosinus mongolicus TaxID=233100 RepID=A0A1R3VZG5_9GAMM|nr:AsmA family protein [Ectothiorhodosinus mongolicus]ULX57220.1 AsmA family protein [Ectothiorhodosinus mongolicus]SIT70485.1 AsmA protein [Ectothiorhodosinus mongolicus]